MKTILDPTWVNRIGRIDPRERVFVSKGWGWEEWLANSPLYCLKRLFIKQGRRNSWHYHEKKDETFTVISGRVLVEYSMEDCLHLVKDVINNLLIEFPDEKGELMVAYCNWSILEPGDTFHVPKLLRHRFSATQDSLLIEASTQHFDEDSIRLFPGD